VMHSHQRSLNAGRFESSRRSFVKGRTLPPFERNNLVNYKKPNKTVSATRAASAWLSMKPPAALRALEGRGPRLARVESPQSLRSRP
jgi:hypothetical protein